MKFEGINVAKATSKIKSIKTNPIRDARRIENAHDRRLIWNFDWLQADKYDEKPIETCKITSYHNRISMYTELIDRLRRNID